jgi:streptomycin 6-kinase
LTQRLAIPRLLTESLRDADAKGLNGLRSWATRLPDVVRELSDRWSLRVGEPFEPGGQCSWVAPAMTCDGRPVALKVGWRHFEAEQEADGLRAWGGRGAVLLYDDLIVDDVCALLLERCRPGRTLDSLPMLEQDQVLAGLLRQLGVEPAAGHSFQPLARMCADWADSFERCGPGAGGRAGADPGLIRAGLKLFRSLPLTAERQVLLATDLHPANVLAAERAPWLMIDPKPWLGDPAYDVLQYMLNHDRLPRDPRAFADRLADLCGLDRERVRLWLFARCVIETRNWPELLDVVVQLAP